MSVPLSFPAPAFSSSTASFTAPAFSPIPCGIAAGRRAFFITVNASTLFSRLVAGAITLMFFTYAFVNMAMVSGLLPVVGVPLPLVSFGGTALVTLFLGIGMLMSIHANRKLVKT